MHSDSANKIPQRQHQRRRKQHLVYLNTWCAVCLMVAAERATTENMKEKVATIEKDLINVSSLLTQFDAVNRTAD